jgi:hypothetical protein
MQITKRQLRRLEHAYNLLKLDRVSINSFDELVSIIKNYENQRPA